MKFGALGNKVVEPSTVSEEYNAEWRRPKLDSEELYYLRYFVGMSYKELAAHFGRSLDSIGWHLDKVR